MKRQFSFLWVGFALFALFALFAALPGCGPSGQTTQRPSSALVKIDCYSASVRQILELLRGSRGKDIRVVAADGSTTQITAAFSPADTPPWKLAQVLQDLNGLSGVLHVDIEENPRPILQNF